MDVKRYLDSTYLKTPAQAASSDAESIAVAQGFINEAIHKNFKLIMLRPDRVVMARHMIDKAGSNVLVGTVVDFPEGNRGAEYKLAEARRAIADGADDLDFVADYTAFIAGDTNKVVSEVLACTQLAVQNGKTAKWIIEVAALNDAQIAALCQLVQKTITANFEPDHFKSVFLKSSTGFYVTKNGLPNGATTATIRIMLDNAGPLPVKAAGGVRSYEEAVAMIKMGVQRIGTSSAKAIADGEQPSGNY